MRRAVPLALAAVALLCALAGGATLLRAQQGLSTQDVTVRGVPLTVVRSSSVERDADGRGVVVAHGFGGSSRLMAGFADSLARRGFAVVLLDFAGHGRNTNRWHDTSALGPDLDVAVAYLRTLPGVDPAKTYLVGHSMGAAAVTAYAASHPDIAATVAISLPGRTDALPRHLLLLVGGLEFRSFRDAATASAQGSDAGDRRAVVVPGVEHISILYAPRTHSEMLDWFGASPGPGLNPAGRVLGGGLLLLAFAFGLYPLAWLLFEPRQPVEPPPAWLPAIAVGACAVAVPVAWLLPDPLPIAVTGYVAIFAAVAGAIMLVAGHRLAWPRVPASVLSCLLLAGYAIAAITVPLHLGLTDLVPAGPRWWLLPIVVAAFAAFAWGNLRLSGTRLTRQLIGAGAAVGALGVATMTGLGPGFLLLVLPLLALLLAYQAVWIDVLRRFAVPAWLMALTGAILPALPALASMPLV